MRTRTHLTRLILRGSDCHADLVPVLLDDDERLTSNSKKIQMLCCSLQYFIYLMVVLGHSLRTRSVLSDVTFVPIQTLSEEVFGCASYRKCQHFGTLGCLLVHLRCGISAAAANVNIARHYLGIARMT